MIPTPPSRILSSNEAAKLLGLPCYLILSGYAKPYFPTTTKTHPSRTVVILPEGVGSASQVAFGILPAKVLPVSVDGQQWKRCVVQVLESNSLVRENLALWSLLPDEVITLIERSIGRSFEAGGYGPYLPG